jgi:hypothetical protein
MKELPHVFEISVKSKSSVGFVCGNTIHELM